MGECGCIMSDSKYTLPAPDDALYIVTLSGHCKNCDAPAGITIERIDKTNGLYRAYKRGEFVYGPLTLEDWPGSKGAAIIAGYRKHEFVKAAKAHLVGVSADNMGEDGVIDDVGAEVLAEDMYDDLQVRPYLVK